MLGYPANIEQGLRTCPVLLSTKMQFFSPLLYTLLENRSRKSSGTKNVSNPCTKGHATLPPVLRLLPDVFVEGYEAVFRRNSGDHEDYSLWRVSHPHVHGSGERRHSTGVRVTCAKYVSRSIPQWLHQSRLSFRFCKSWFLIDGGSSKPRKCPLFERAIPPSRGGALFPEFLARRAQSRHST